MFRTVSKHLQNTHLTLLMLLLTTAFSAAAYNISGTVADRQDEPLVQATVRLLKPDSTYVAGTATDIDGRYRLTGISNGKYILEATYLGYATATQDIEVKGASLRRQSFRLDEESQLLKEIEVVAVKTPIKVSNDTVEYNADTYKTQPNAVVEDLLKRLPGVEVGTDGSITANGQTVTKILLNGKEFFADDPKVASKNLPVEMIDKLQVVNRKSDLARLTGVDDGEEETVINLTIKKGMENGWNGNVQGGYGTDNRYLGSFFLNTIQHENQFTLLGNLNNINEIGFTDGNGQRFRRWGGNNGITTSRSVGFNFNVSNEEILRVGGNVMYSNTDNDVVTRSRNQLIFPDRNTWEDEDRQSFDTGHNLRGDFRLEWRPDSFNILEFRPNISYNTNRSSLIDDTEMRNMPTPGQGLINTQINRDRSRGNSFEFGGRLIYTHNFNNHRGRSISFMGNYRLSNVWEKEYSLSITKFYQELMETETPDELLDQYTTNHTWSNRLMGRLSWTEPLGNVANGNFLTLSYQANYRWNNADKLVYNRIPADDVIYDPSTQWLNTDIDLFNSYDPELSNSFRNNFLSQDIRIGYKKVSATINAEAGLSLVPSYSKSTNLTNADKSIPARTVWNFAPFVRFRYRISQVSSLAINYRGRSSEPNMNQLQPIADMSDPMNVVQGNPNLKPSFQHWGMVRYNDFDQDTQRSIMVMGHFDFTQNSVASNTTMNPETGARYTTYENVNGEWSAHVMNMLSFPFARNKAWSFNNFLNLEGRRNVGFNDGLRNATFNFSVREAPSIAFRPDNLELELRPFYGFSNTTSSIPTIAGTEIHSWGATFNGTYYTPWGLSINTEVNYSDNTGYAQGIDSESWLWNAQLSYQFLKGKAATIAVKVYDLLGQVNNIRRNVTASSISDVEYNTLTRYFMLTFTYTFNTFASGAPEQRGPGGMRPPMGGPGGHRH